MCFDKNLLHGDFYARNCLWNTTVVPPTVSLLDFDRAEIVSDRDKLGRAWINSIASYLFEIFERATLEYKVTLSCPMSDLGSDVVICFQKLMKALFQVS